VAIGGLMLIDTITNDYKNAFYRQSERLRLQKEILNETKQADILELREKYQSEQKEKALKQSESALKQEKESARLRNILLITLSAILIMLTIISIVFRTLNMRNKKLSIKNEFLLKEQNHRIKNNLQMISNLLSLQSSSVQSQEGKNALNEGKSRIQSISLLHRMLYKNNGFSAINIHNYLLEINNELSLALPRTYKLNSQIDKSINLPIEKAISIGLLLNELITNSIKHIQEDQVPELSLTITNHDGITLIYSDNGQGITNEEWDKSNSLGNRLIRMMSQQLDGKYKIDNNKGFCFNLHISLN